MASKAEQFKTLIDKGLPSFIQNMKDNHPQFAGLEVKPSLRVYPKRPKGYSGHQLKVAQGFLTNTGFLAMTNNQVVDHMAGWYPGYLPSHSLMNVRLHKRSREAIQSELDKAGIAATVRPSDTLSTLKKIIRAKGRAETRSFAVTVELSDEWVTIDGVPIAVDQTRIHPSIRVTVNGKRQYLRCDILQGLLEGTT